MGHKNKIIEEITEYQGQEGFSEAPHGLSKWAIPLLPLLSNISENTLEAILVPNTSIVWHLMDTLNFCQAQLQLQIS